MRPVKYVLSFSMQMKKTFSSQLAHKIKHTIITEMAAVITFIIITSPPLLPPMMQHCKINHHCYCGCSILSVPSFHFPTEICTHFSYTEQKFTRSLCYRLIYEHFGENHAIVLQKVAKWRCIKPCAILSEPLSTAVWKLCKWRHTTSVLCSELIEN